MKNLNLFCQKDVFSDCKNVCSVSVDELTSAVVICSGDELVVLGGNGPYHFKPDDGFGRIVSCHATEHSMIYIVCRFGILLWRANDNTILDSFSTTQEIDFASLSTKGSCIAFVSVDNFVTLLTLSLKPLITTSLTQDGFGKAAPITLGWGKKETQFQGSSGKQSALSQPEVACDADDSGLRIIAWRDDGQYFVVSLLDTKQVNHRHLRIFTQSGELFSTSESMKGLEPALCWRPRIQLIAAPLRRQNRGLDVIFFETNAERHGEFELLTDTLEAYYEVIQMSFEEHGDVFASLCFPRSKRTQTHPAFIRLVTCSNYKWSIKRDLVLTDVGSPLDESLRCPITYTWTTGTPRVGLCSLIFCHPKELQSNAQTVTGTLVRSWNLSAAYDRHCWSAADPPSLEGISSPGLVAVVDHSSVLLTAMAHSVIPPPMYSTRLNVSRAPDDASGILCPVVTGVSFPGPWVPASDASLVPMLIQLESLSCSPELIMLSLHCGVNRQRREEFHLGRFILESQWVTGSQKSVPWPMFAHFVDFSSETTSSAIADDSVCWPYGTELSHFCWFSYSQVAFVAWCGYRIGLLESNQHAVPPDVADSRFKFRWILLIDAHPHHSAKEDSSYLATPLRFCGMCLDPGGGLCVQLTDGKILVFEMNKLLASPHPVIIPTKDEECFLSAMSDTLRYVITLPLPCEQLAVIRLSSITGERLTAENGPLKISSSSPVTRSILLGFHKPSQRLYGAQLPLHSAEREILFVPEQPEPARVLLELCSSLIVLPDYLLVTSVRQFLICVPLFMDSRILINPVACLSELTVRLSIPPTLLAINPDKSRNWYDDFLHPIERDAVLVNSIPSEARVILQAPRGNLEEIHPRALILSLLTNLLDSLNYAKAMVLMRRHRINFNLLYDHNPGVFMKNLNHLLESVVDTDLITLFVSELVDEDVSKTIYGKFYGDPSIRLFRTKHASIITPSMLSNRRCNKVNTICDALIHRMLHNKRFLLPVLTCYAKKLPPDLASALLLLHEYHENKEDESWGCGVRHLQYFATPLELYRIALGTYNLDLAQSMAQRSKLDPKEYLADLNGFRSITCGDNSPGNSTTELTAYQRYKIDHHLQRYSKALHHLSQAGPEHISDFIQYADDHRLHHEAMEYCEPHSEEAKLIGRSWANLLVKEQKLYFAGLVYLRSGLFGAAARVFLSCLQARMWSIAATQACSVIVENTDTDVYLNEQEFTDQGRKLASRLRDLGRYDEAIVIYLDHLKDPKSALLAALDGGLWVEAHRLASTHRISELLDENLKPKLLRSYSDLSERLSQVGTEFIALFERLMILRRVHKEEAQATRIAESFGDIDAIEYSSVETESFSDSSSTSQGSTCSIGEFSLQSGSFKNLRRSKKKTRKKEARKWSTKPGSKYEEVGLLDSLARSIQSTQRLADEAAVLIVELWKVSLVTEGRKLQQQTNELLTDQKDAVPVIWDDWITGKLESNENSNNEGRKRYPFKEAFIDYAPDMKITDVQCFLLDPK